MKGSFMRKPRAIVLCSILFVGLLFMITSMITKANQTVILINSAEKLANITNLTGHYKLIADIDLSNYTDSEGKAWKPIYQFNGTFDGNGYKIINLTMTRTDSDYTGGLFDTLYPSAKVSNLTLENVNVVTKSSASATGALVGENKGTIENVTVVGGTVTGSNNTGGLVGKNTNGVITDSSSSAQVTGTNNVGGLVGYVENSFADGNFTRLQASGDVTGAEAVGGLFGRFGHTSYNNFTLIDSSATGNVNGKSEVGGLIGISYAPVSEVHATGEVIATGDSVGGLIGQNIKNSVVSESYARGKVSSQGNRVGGLVGNQEGLIERSYALGKVQATSYLGGLIGTSKALIQHSFASGDVTGSGGAIGGLVGYLVVDNYVGTGSIVNSFATGKVSGQDSIGGLVGHSNDTGVIIEHSSAFGTVFGRNEVGGLVGYSNAETTSSYAMGDVTATGSGVGGLIASTFDSVRNSFSTGNVSTAKNDNGSSSIGGLIGYTFRNLEISGVYTTGNGTATGNFYGGLIGVLGDNKIPVTNAYYTGTVSSPGLYPNSVGTKKTEGELKQKSTTGFQFVTADKLDNPWLIVPGETLPFIQNPHVQKPAIQLNNQVPTEVSIGDTINASGQATLTAAWDAAYEHPSMKPLYIYYSIVDEDNQPLADYTGKLLVSNQTPGNSESFNFSVNIDSKNFTAGETYSVQIWAMTMRGGVSVLSQPLTVLPDPEIASLSAKLESGDAYMPGTWSRETVIVTPNFKYDEEAKREYAVVTDPTAIIWRPYNEPIEVSTSGEFTVYIKTENKLGKTVQDSIEIKIDKDSPTTPNIQLTGSAIGGWANGKVTVEITEGTDALSGVAYTEYKIGDDESWTKYTLGKTFEIENEGITKVYARTVDKAGNRSDVAVQEVKIDLDKPSSPSIQMRGPISTDGWANGTVTVEIAEGTDVLSGVDYTEYKIGDDGQWTKYKEAIEIENEGITKVSARTVDKAGNRSDTVEQEVKIDLNKPSVPTLQLTGPISSDGWANDKVTVEITDGTDAFSGVDYTEYKVGDDGEWTKYTEPIEIENEGITKISARTVDKAGNRSEPAQATVRINENKPIITLLGDNPFTLEVDSEYKDPGAQATDDIDGDLTTYIVIDSSQVDTSKLGEYEVTYTVTDSAGNTTIEKRTVEVVDTTKPILTLLGDNPVTVEVGDNYEEPGATAQDNYDGDISDNIKITGEVNTKKIGTYTVTYSVTDSSGNTNTKERTVEVVDTTSPIITLKGDNPLTLRYGETYNEPGYTVTDNSSEALSDKIKVTGNVDTTMIGTYTLTYTVKDSSGNEATPVIRTVHVVDEDAPVIILKDKNPMTLEVGGTYNEPGATANDAYDGDLTNQIVITGTVDTTKLGTYQIHYNVTDSSGNKSIEVIRDVHIVDTTPPTLTLNGKETIRLEAGETYTELGAIATDNYDGDITNNIKITGKVDTNQPGTYTIKYQVTDSSSNETTVTRTVIVAGVTGIDITAPKIIKVGQDVTLKVIAAYTDGVERDITTEANYTLSDTQVANINNGTLTGKKAGVNPITLTIRYKEQAQELTFKVVNQHAALNQPVQIKAGDLFFIEDSETYIQIPQDLPNGTTIQVTPSKQKAPGLIPAGNSYDFQFTFPNGTSFTGTYRLTMGVQDGINIEKTGIYYFNEQTNEWEYIGGWGNAKDGRIVVSVSHFSTYGVFTDTQGPTNIIIKEKGKTTNSITLELSASDPSGIKEYILTRNGKTIATIAGSETEWTDTKLKPGQTYTYTVIAVDQLGNESEKASITITTEQSKKQPSTAEEQQEENDSSTGGKDSNKTNNNGDDKTTDKLPKTGTNIFNWILAGAALLFVGTTFLIKRRKNPS